MAEPAPSEPRRSAADFDARWLRDHIAEERRRTEILGEIREAVFGLQDGLVTTLTVVSTVGGATSDRFPILVAGIATGLAGVFSMAFGEYMASKSQREIYEYTIEGEREEAKERPEEAQAEVAFMLEQEGLPAETAGRVAADLAKNQNVLLKTMVEKEHGIAVDAAAGPLQGALIMGITFGLGAAVTILPYLLLSPGAAPAASIALTGLVLFGIGVVKSRWTRKSPIRSGLEIVALAALAAIAGYLFGRLLPDLLGVSLPRT